MKIKKLLLTNKFVLPVLAFVLLCCIYPAGALNSKTKIEETSSYISNIANNTQSNTVPVIVESKTDGTSSLIDTATEYRYLYGIFGGGNKAYFAATVNADKENTIYCPDLLNNINYSFLYAETGFSNKKQPDSPYYRHEFYPINLMFKGEHRSLSGSFSFLYISQSQADTLLDNYELEHTTENYEFLLGKGINLDINGSSYLWLIEDIYIESGTYFNDVHNAIGDFFFGYKQYPKGVKKQAMYFLNESEYENNFFLEHISTVFEREKVTLKFSGKNLDHSLLQNIYNSSSNILSVFIFVFSIFALASLFIFGHINGVFSKPLNILLFIPSFICPWCIYKIISVSSHTLLFFSTISNGVFLLTFIIAEIFILSSFLIKNYFRKEKRFENKYCEINI